MKLSPQRKAILKEKMGKSLVLLGKVCVPQMFSLPSPFFHYKLSKVGLNKLLRKVVVEAPRTYAKSSVYGCLLPLHHIFYDKGFKVIVLVSKTQGHSINLLQTIKDVLDYSMELRQFFGYWGRHSALEWTKDKIVLKDGTTIFARGTGQQIRGLKVGHQRPTLILVDDPEDENNTKTDEAMEVNLRWLLAAATKSLDQKRGRIIVIGTPQHERCITQTLKDMSDWYYMHFSCIQDDDTALWPEMETREEIEADFQAHKSINRTSLWYREKMCIVMGDEDQLFTPECIRYYSGEVQHIADRECVLTLTRLGDEKFDVPKKLIVYTFTGIDPASSTKQTADFSTIVSLARDDQAIRYVLPYYREHVKPHDLADAIIERDEMYMPQQTRCESVGYQEMLREEVRRRKYIPGIEVPANPRSQKSKRLEAMQPPFYRGQVYLLGEWDEEKGRWNNLMPEMKAELLMYPRGKNDDLLDGLYYAMKCSFSPWDSTVPEHYGSTVPAELSGEGIAPHGEFYNWKVL